MKSRLDAGRRYRSTLARIVPFHTAVPLMVFGVLLPSVAAMAAGEKAFVVLPGSAPRFSGPRGREADVTEFLATREQTGGAFGLFRQTIAPKSGPPAHIHRGADEFFYVVSGEFRVKLGDRILRVPAGSFGFVPEGLRIPSRTLGRSPGFCWSA